MPNAKLKQLAGCFLVFAAAACYYLSTVVIRQAGNHVSIAPAFFVFVRFFLGFAIVCGSMLIKGRRLKPKRYDLLIGRAVANGAAVYCFYTAVTKTTLAQANILNMTYPIFVALLSWIFLKKQRDLTTTIGAGLAFAGIYLILAQGPLEFGWLHLWGLASGISASLAMIFLNLSRRYHDTETILFYLFGIGSILTYAAFSHAIHWPGPTQTYYLALSSGFAIMGQYCITFGYRYVTAVEGGIISSSRILLAATMGPFIAADPFLDLKGWLGAGLIFLVNVALAWRKSKSGRRTAPNHNNTRLRPRQNNVPICVNRRSPVGLPARIKTSRRKMLAKARFRAQVRNNSTGLRRICVRLQGTSAGAYHKSQVCAGGCNTVDGRKEKQVGGIISCLRPKESAMKMIRQAHRQDRDQINARRIREFQRSAQFTLIKPEKLKWNHCDDTSIVLSAWDGPCAVATMRAVAVSNAAQAESCLQCIVPAHIDFPAMVFNSAATHWDYRGIGLNQLLRYHFLKIAMGCEIQSLLSPMYEGAPRIRFMKALGYQFITPPLSWQKKLNPKATRILGILGRAMMPQAMNLIKTQRHEIINAYPWKGKSVQFNNLLFLKADLKIMIHR